SLATHCTLSNARNTALSSSENSLFGSWYSAFSQSALYCSQLFAPCKNKQLQQRVSSQPLISPVLLSTAQSPVSHICAIMSLPCLSAFVIVLAPLKNAVVLPLACK